MVVQTVNPIDTRDLATSIQVDLSESRHFREDPET